MKGNGWADEDSPNIRTGIKVSPRGDPNTQTHKKKDDIIAPMTAESGGHLRSPPPKHKWKHKWGCKSLQVESLFLKHPPA